MGLLARLLNRSSAGFAQQPQHGSGLTAARFPDLPQGFQTYTGPDTDPQQWAYGTVNVASLLQAQAFDVHDTFYRWCGQIIEDRTSTSLLRFAREQPEYMAVYLEMKRLGRRVRQQVGERLLKEFREDLKRQGDACWKQIPGVFDPELPLPWSRAHLLHKVCEINGIELVRMSEAQRETAAHFSGTSAWPVYAFMQIYGPMRAPIIAVNVYPLGIDRGPDSGDPLWYDNTNAWTFAAACCLAKFFKDRELYEGVGAQPEIIAPFDLQAHATLIPLFHVFAKALLRFHPRCPHHWPCYCNSLADIFQLATDAPRQETGVLPARPVAMTEPPTPNTPNTAGGFGQAVPLSRSLGQPAPTSRGMTPPRGTSGELLRLYNEQRRRDTGHGLERGSR